MASVRDLATARIACPDCGDWLVPLESIQRVEAPDARGDLICLGCETRFPWRDDVLGLGGSAGDRAVLRRFPMGSDVLSFLGLLEETLRLARNSDRTFEDEIYSLLSWLDPDPGHNVLVLGADDGRLLPPLAQAIVPGVLVAVESDERLLGLARRRCLDQGATNVVLVHGDLQRPAMRSGGFDRVVLCGVLHWTDQPASYAEEQANLLVDDGVAGGVALARSAIPRIASQQERFGQTAGVHFADMQAFGHQLCQRTFEQFQMDQASNWVARFVARKKPVFK